MSYENTLPGRAALNSAAPKEEPGPPSPSQQSGADEVATRSLEEVKRSLSDVTAVLEKALRLEAETVAALREVLDRLHELYRLELSRKLSPSAPALGWRLGLSAVFGSVLTTLLLFATINLGR